MKARAPVWSLLLLGFACQPEETVSTPPAGPSPQVEPEWFQSVVDTALADLEGQGLVTVSATELREVLELLETSQLPGRVGALARRDLQSRPPLFLNGALMDILESRESTTAQRRLAYAWLEQVGVAAVMPRLLLRRKYEKDLLAYVALARALLKLENGGALEGLLDLLQREEAGIEEIRRQAAAALALLPETEEWQPGGSFEQDWAHLLACRHSWFLQRELVPGEGPPAPFDSHLQAEVWRMIDRLNSQALRPVDDARFVLGSLPLNVVGLLCQATRERSHYVREAVMQTLSWRLGHVCGRFARRSDFQWAAHFETMLDEPRSRTRVLEALGAAGLAEAVPVLQSWLETGSWEEKTAAADALLRCADDSALSMLQGFRQKDIPLSAEATYSLQLLEHALDPNAAPPAPPESLAQGEKERRDRWLFDRQHRPGSETLDQENMPAAESGSKPGESQSLR
ncbi:MAG: hypothetical protein DWQ01_02985 [Planctomycetota bacterium]|nr:MAG: hypothetical protein DWQ01_02985 [Planctomycetota bacterium]